MANILLVEDDEYISEELKDYLTSNGHCVEAVFSGPEALEHLLFNSYDLVFLDSNLPGKNGRDVCCEFRKKGGVTPVVMLTGESALHAMEECMKAGANLFLEKPFPLEELDTVITRYTTDLPAASSLH